MTAISALLLLPLALNVSAEPEVRTVKAPVSSGRTVAAPAAPRVAVPGHNLPTNPAGVSAPNVSGAPSAVPEGRQAAGVAVAPDQNAAASPEQASAVSGDLRRAAAGVSKAAVAPEPGRVESVLDQVFDEEARRAELAAPAAQQGASGGVRGRFLDAKTAILRKLGVIDGGQVSAYDQPAHYAAAIGKAEEVLGAGAAAKVVAGILAMAHDHAAPALSTLANGALRAAAAGVDQKKAFEVEAKALGDWQKLFSDHGKVLLSNKESEVDPYLRSLQRQAIEKGPVALKTGAISIEPRGEGFAAALPPRALDPVPANLADGMALDMSALAPALTAYEGFREAPSGINIFHFYRRTGHNWLRSLWAALLYEGRQALGWAWHRLHGAAWHWLAPSGPEAARLSDQATEDYRAALSSIERPVLRVSDAEAMIAAARSMGDHIGRLTGDYSGKEAVDASATRLRAAVAERGLAETDVLPPALAEAVSLETGDSLRHWLDRMNERLPAHPRPAAVRPSSDGLARLLRDARAGSSAALAAQVQALGPAPSEYQELAAVRDGGARFSAQHAWRALPDGGTLEFYVLRDPRSGHAAAARVELTAPGAPARAVSAAGLAALLH